MEVFGGKKNRIEISHHGMPTVGCAFFPFSLFRFSFLPLSNLLSNRGGLSLKSEGLMRKAIERLFVTIL